MTSSSIRRLSIARSSWYSLAYRASGQISLAAADLKRENGTMPANAFISFDHDDQQQVAGFKLLKNNPRHPLDFQDHSLKDAVRDRTGKPIKYPPSDSRSKPVRDEIVRKFD